MKGTKDSIRILPAVFPPSGRSWECTYRKLCSSVGDGTPWSRRTVGAAASAGTEKRARLLKVRFWLAKGVLISTTHASQPECLSRFAVENDPGAFTLKE